MQTIRIEKTTNPKEKPGQDNPLVFGTIFTDHMFEVDYEEGKGWSRSQNSTVSFFVIRTFCHGISLWTDHV